MFGTCYSLQNMNDLFVWWRWHSDLKTSWSNRLNYLRQALSISDYPTEWHICLHRPSKSSLSLFCQIINLMDHNYLERLLLLLLKLLAASNFFDQFLNNDFVMVVSLTWRNLDMIIRWKYDTLNRGVSRCSRLEFFQLTLDFVNCICTIKLLEQTFGQGSLSTSRWPIKQDVREIIRFGQLLKHVNLVIVHWNSLVEVHGSVFLHPKSLLCAHIFWNFC